MYIHACICICISFQHTILTYTCYSLAFSQPATGPSSVCEGSNVTLQCVIVLNLNDNTTIVQPSVWTRNGILATTIPNHRLVFNSTTGGFTDLVITDVTLADNNTVYACTDNGATITSSVVLNVTGNYCMYVLCCTLYIHVNIRRYVGTYDF